MSIIKETAPEVQHPRLASGLHIHVHTCTSVPPRHRSMCIKKSPTCWYFSRETLGKAYSEEYKPTALGCLSSKLSGQIIRLWLVSCAVQVLAFKPGYIQCSILAVSPHLSLNKSELDAKIRAQVAYLGNDPGSVKEDRRSEDKLTTDARARDLLKGQSNCLACVGL